MLRLRAPRRSRLIFAACLGAWLLPAASWAGPAFVQGKSYYAPSGNDNVISITLNGVKAGNLLAVFATIGGSGATMTCSDDVGNVYTTARNIADASNNQMAGMCYGAAATGGTITITVSYSAPEDYRAVLVHEISGVVTSGPLDGSAGQAQLNAGTAPNGVTSGAFATSTSGDYIFSATVEDSLGGCPQTVSPGTGFTGRLSAACTNQLQMRSEDMVQSAAGSVSGTFTDSLNASMITGAMAFKPFAPPGSAIVSVQSTGAFTTPSGTSATSTPFAINPVVGNKVIVLAWSYNSSAAPVISASDSRGNTYTSDAQSAGARQTAAVLSAPIAATGANFTVTVTASVSAQIMAVAIEYSGLGARDRTGTSTGTAASPTVSTTGATTVSKELVASALGIDTPTPSFTSILPAAGYSDRATQLDNSGDTAGEGSDKLVAATGVQTNTWTTSPASTLWAAAIATYRPIMKLQLLLPGETAAPGTPSGKTGTPTAQTAGTSFSVTVNAVDANWNLVNTVTDTVGITSSDASAILPVNAALVAGTKTFTVTLKTAGTATVTATDITDGTKTANTSPSVTVNPGPASKLAFTAQPSNATAGVSIAPAVQVAVQDTSGNTVTSSTASITLAIGTNPGSGTLSGTVTVSAVAGVATFSNLSIDKAGAGYTLVASSGVLTNGTSTGFNIAAGTATKLSFTVHPTNAAAGSSIAPAVQVAVQDTFGNTVTTSTASISLAITTNPGGGTLSGTNPKSAVAGVATFSNLSINKTGTGYVLTATSAGLADGVSGTFNITAGAANKLAFSVQPAATTAGLSISPAVQVAVQDSFGNTVTTSTASIALAFGNNAGGGTLSGTNPQSAIAGVATFGNLAIDKVGVGYTLTASSGALTLDTSAAFDITVGAANKVAFTVAPTNTTAGSGIAPAVRATVEDSQGNTITSSSASITLAIGTNPGGGTLSGTVTQSAAAGVATFAGLSIDKAGLGYTLTAASAGLTSGTSGGFNIVAGAAAKLAFTVQPAPTTAGAAITPSVTVQDALGNTVTSSSASVTIAIGTNPGGGLLSGTNPKAAVSGVTTFGNLSIDKVGTGYTLTASSGALTGATSITFDISPGAATQLAFTVQPANTVAGSSIAPAVVVKVEDALGNTVTSSSAGITLGIGANPGGGILSGTNPQSAVAGVATFSNLSIDRAGVGYTLTASGTGLTSDTSNSFDIAVGAAAKLAFTVNPSNATAGASIAPAIDVTVQDALGNTVPISTATITLAVGTNPGGGTLTGTNPFDASAGVATFSNLSIDKAGVGYTLTATSPGLTGATSTGFNIAVAAASKLAFTTGPSTTTAGVAIAPAVVVTVQDAFGNTVTSSSASITLAIGANPGGGALSGTNPKSAASGVATFSNLSIDKTGVGYTLTASSGALTGATSAPFDIVPGAANKLAFSVAPGNTTAGASIAPALVVTVQDSLGNTVTSSSASIAVAIGANPGSGTLSGTTPVSAAAGVATFSNLSIDKTGVGYTLTITSGGLTGATSGAFNIVPGAANKLAFTVQPASTTAGAALTPTVTVQDALGNTVTSSSASILVAIGTNPGGGALSGTNPKSAASGVAAFANLAIDKVGVGYTLTATSAGLTGATSVTFNINSGVATQLAFTAQPLGTTAGGTIAPTLEVQDAYGNTVPTATPSITVAIGTNPGGGVLSGTNPKSAVAGVASFADLSIDKTGTGYTLTASAGGLTGATSNTFDITVLAASKVAFTVQPTNASAGATIAPSVVVEVQDSFGNTVGGASNSITLTIGTNPGGGTLGGTVTVSAVNGAATFSTLSIDKVGVGYTLTANASGLTSATSATFNIAGGAAAKLGFTVQPAATVAGASIAPAIVVAVQDAFGNTVTSSSASITLAIGANPGGGTLSGTNPKSAASGLATFSNLAIDKTGVGYTLAATSGVLTGATSLGFDIVPGAANKLAFTVAPSNTTAGAAMAPAVVVAVEDSLGNVVTSSSASVSLAIGVNPGGGTLSGTTPVTAVTGLATLANLSIDKSGNGYTLVASSGALTGATSAGFNIITGAGTKLAFTVQPANATAGAAITPTVAVQDALGNTIASSSASISMAIGTNPGGGTLSGTNPVAAVAGLAAFGNLAIDKTGVGYTLIASAAGLTGATSVAFNIMPGAANKLAFTVQPVTTTAGAAITPTVTVQDALGNTVTSSVASITVAIGANPGLGTLSGTNPKSAVGGVASFANLSINKTGVGYTLTASSGALTGATSVTFDVTAGAATKLAFSVQPASTAAGASITPTVVVQDSLGNTVPSSVASITVAIGTNPGGGTLSGTNPVAAVAGLAAFGNLSIDVTGVGYTLIASATGLTGASSVAFNISAGAASKLAFMVQPSSATAGASIAPAVAVAVQDAFGNTVTASVASIAVAIGANPGGGTLSGTTPKAAVSGVATFSNLSIDRTGVGYTLTASSGTLAGATSATFDVTVGAPVKLAFTVQPGNTTAGLTINPTVTVTVQDALGNTDTSYTASIALAIGANPGGGTLSGTTPASAVSGVATFSNLSIEKVGVGYTLTASAAGLTGATSAAFGISVGVATKLTFTAQPTSSVAGVAIAPAVVVTVEDAFGNTDTASAVNVSLALGANPGSTTLSGTASQAASGGVATFSNLSLDKVGTGYTLVASSGVLAGATSVGFDIAVAPAAKLAFTVQPASTSAGAAITPSVEVEDVFGNLVTSSVASIAVVLGANPGGGVLSGTALVAAAGGVSAFTNLSLDKVGVGYTLTASSAGLAGASSAAFDIAAGAPVQLAFLVQPASAAAGASLTPTVGVEDAFGNLVSASAAAVTLAIGNNPGGGTLLGTTPISAVAGVATFGNLSIDKTGVGYTLTASSGGLLGATSAAFDITAGAAAQLAFLVQPSSALAGVALSPSVQVAVLDAMGNALTSSTAGIALALGSNPGGGTLAGGGAVAVVGGVAPFAGLWVDKAGVGYSLTASSAGLTSATSASFDIGVAAVAKLAFVVQPTSLAAGGTVSPAVQVAVEDAFGNTDASSTAGITLALGNNPGGSVLGGVATATASGGVATFAGLSLDKVGVGYTLTAASSGLPVETSAAFDVTQGAAAKLAFVVQPLSAPAGAPLAVSVELLDAQGNVVTTSTASVVLALGNNPGGGTLSGATAVAAAGGVAAFTGLSVNRPGVGYTLTASSSGLTGATSAAFDISAGAAAQLAFVVNPVTTVAGATLTPAVVVAVQDTSGNTVPSWTASIFVSLQGNPGNATLRGGRYETAVEGLAGFADLTVDAAGVGYTLSATAPGLGTATSAAFDVTAGATSKLAFLVQPSRGELATPLSPAVRVAVQDAFGNSVPGASATIVLSLQDNPGLAILSGASLASTVDGVAGFSDLSLNRAGTGYTLKASSPGMADVTSDAFDVVLTPERSYTLGCGCLSSAGAGIGLWGLLGLGALARRPRRAPRQG